MLHLKKLESKLLSKEEWELQTTEQKETQVCYYTY